MTGVQEACAEKLHPCTKFLKSSKLGSRCIEALTINNGTQTELDLEWLTEERLLGLAARVEKGGKVNIEFGFDLMALTDGCYSESLSEALGNSMERTPDAFLLIFAHRLKSIEPKNLRIDSLVGALGPEYVDDFEGHRRKLGKRLAIIKRVKVEEELRATKDLVIAELKEAIKRWPEEIPIWWNREMGSGMLHEKTVMTAGLADRLELTWDEASFLTIKYKDGEDTKQKQVKSCKELLETAITDTVSTIDWEIMRVWRTDCWCISKAIELTEAHFSYLDLDSKAWITKLSSIQLESDYLPYKLFFESLSTEHKYRDSRDSTILLETATKDFGLKINARGDFDSDEVEDFVLLAQSSPLDGHGLTVLGFVITQQGNNKDFKVLDWFKKD